MQNKRCASLKQVKLIERENMDQQAIQERIEFLLQQTMDDSTIAAYKPLGPAVIPLLIKALQNPDVFTRSRAVFALGGIADPQAFTPLCTLINDPDPVVRSILATSLGELGLTEAFEPLTHLLNDKKPAVRSQALQALASLNDPRSIPYAIKLLSDRSPLVTSSAVFVLQTLKKQALEPIIELLDTAPIKSYPAIFQALTLVSPRTANAKLNQLIQHTQATKRQQAAAILAELKEHQAIPALSILLQDPVPTVRSAAAQTLREFSSKRALPALINAITDSDANVRAYAAEALGKIGDKRAVKPLLALADDTSEVDTGNPHTMRSVVIFALSQIGDRQALNTLLTALNDPDADVRWAAAIGLGKIKDPSAIPALRKALDDEEEVSWGGELVSEAAEQALNELKAS
jgi:HEAT repeat protein